MLPYYMYVYWFIHAFCVLFNDVAWGDKLWLIFPLYPWRDKLWLLLPTWLYCESIGGGIYALVKVHIKVMCTTYDNVHNEIVEERCTRKSMFVGIVYALITIQTVTFWWCSLVSRLISSFRVRDPGYKATGNVYQSWSLFTWYFMKKFYCLLNNWFSQS